MRLIEYVRAEQSKQRSSVFFGQNGTRSPFADHNVCKRYDLFCLVATRLLK